MTNINVRIVGTANVTAMEKSFAALESQVTALNAQLARMVDTSRAVDAGGYERMASAAAMNSRVFRSAAASTGMFEVQQLKLNKATDDFVSKLNKQKLSYRDIKREWTTAKAAYREQLAMQNMIVKQSATSTIHGKSVLDVVYPREVTADMDTMGKRVAWYTQLAKSAATQTINWGKNMQWAGRQMTMGITAPLVALGAASGVLAYQVDKQLTRITKVYDTTANSFSTNSKDQIAVQKELAQVRVDGFNTAVKAAKAYGSAGTDTLAVEAELAATGQKGVELQKATANVMRISRLGELDYNDSIAATIALQSVFKMSSKELGDSFNYMNAIENATSLSTQDFAQAIPIAAAPVREFGGDIKELGILLTAMKERGIPATQAANTLKAAMQRLGRPSAKVREEFQAITGADITKIFKESHGLIDLFTRLNAVTANLSNKDKIKAFAGLFGTYQVTRMEALVSGMGDLQKGVGQVSRAYEIAGMDQSKWAKIADQELKQYSDSLSGKFEKSLQTAKLELSTFGKPFVATATVMINKLTDLMTAFSKLPTPVKYAAAGVLGITAIVGPLTMLIGLFANLGGNIVKYGATFIAWTNRAGKSVQFMTTSERAAMEATNLQTASMTEQMTAAELLQVSINKLMLAQEEANAVLRRQQVESMVAGGMGRAQAESIVAAQQMEDQLRTQQALQEKNVVATSKLKTVWKGVASHAGLAALAAGTLFFDSKGAVGQAAKLLLIYSMLAPILNPLGKTMVERWTATRALAAETAASSVAAEAGAAAAGARSAGIISKTLPLLSRAAAFIGPTGLVVAGGFALYEIWKHIDGMHKKAEERQRKILQQQRDGAQAIADASKTYADQTGKALNNIKTNLSTLQTASSLPISMNSQDTLINQYRGDQWKDYMKQFRASAMTSSGGVNDQQRLVMQRFWELQNENGMSAKQAAANIRAMYIAAGTSATVADTHVQQLMQDLGNLKNAPITTQGKILDNFASYIKSSGYEAIKNVTPDLANEFLYMFNKAQTGSDSQYLAKSMTNSVNDAWSAALMKLDSQTRDALANIGVTTGNQFKELMDSYGKKGSVVFEQLITKNATWYNNLVATGKTLPALFGDATKDASTFEQEMVKTIEDTLHLNKNYKTLADLLKDPIFKAKLEPITVDTIKNFQSMLDSLLQLEARGTENKGSAGSNDLQVAKKRKEILQQIDQVLEANGVKTNNIKTVEQGIVALQNVLNGKVDEQGNALDTVRNKALSVADAMRQAFAGITQSNFVDIYKSGMQGVQQDIVDAEGAAFDKKMNIALDARQKMWDNRAAGLQNQMDRASNALDAKWEERKSRADAYWKARAKAVQNQIDAEQKAEDSRKKMFDAEIERINKLNEVANRNIDFNVALNTGNLDEAAKIRNDAAAANAQTALDKAAEAGSARSAARIERLQNKSDRIQNAQDAAMKALDKKEKAEKNHLSRVQKMRTDALKRQTDADMAAQKNMWDNEKKSEDERAQLFMSFIAGNQTQLKKWMNQVGLNYDKFQKDVITPKGETWGSWFGNRLKYHMRKSGMELASDAMWKALGEHSAVELLKGIGFNNMGEFRKFLQTGIMPVHKQNAANLNPTKNKPHTYHGGGMVGTGGSGRGNVAANRATDHPSETWIRAQNGEFVVQRNAVKGNEGLLDAINRGEAPGVGGEAPGIAGLMAGALNKMLLKGMEKTFANSYSKKLATSSVLGVAGAAPVGLYGDRRFTAAQLRNAKTIADVGRQLGMSKRDIEIAIMTSITESGLSNLNYGDRDSLGLFQQRPSQGWGSPAQVTNPNYAAGKFYNSLKGVVGRNKLAPWLAAQAVQRSAFSSGSNYRANWDSAVAIVNAMMRSGVPAGAGAASYAPGPGGWHIPAPRGYRWANTHDYDVPRGTPLYAVSDGTIVESRSITHGGSPGNGLYSTPYTSYGETVVMRTKDGALYRWAHLTPHTRIGLGPVKGGTMIGRSGETGNAWGPHVHMDVNGDYNARGWLAQHGIHLKKGAANIKWDNTIANLHKGEGVLTEELNKKFHQGVENFANGGNNEYNITVNVNGEKAADHRLIVREVIKEIDRRDERKPRSRRG